MIEQLRPAPAYRYECEGHKCSHINVTPWASMALPYAHQQARGRVSRCGVRVYGSLCQPGMRVTNERTRALGTNGFPGDSMPLSVR